MKSAAVFALAFACVLGLAVGQFGFGAQPATGAGNGGFIALIGLLVIVFALFGTKSLSGGTNTFIYGNFSGPTGGK